MAPTEGFSVAADLAAEDAEVAVADLVHLGVDPVPAGDEVLGEVGTGHMAPDTVAVLVHADLPATVSAAVDAGIVAHPDGDKGRFLEVGHSGEDIHSLVVVDIAEEVDLAEVPDHCCGGQSWSILDLAEGCQGSQKGN
jgi:hypothetical protein